LPASLVLVYIRPYSFSNFAASVFICTSVNLCQKCFFKKKRPRSHEPDHDFALLCDPDEDQNDVTWSRWYSFFDMREVVLRCSSSDICGSRGQADDRYRCDSCFRYDLCGNCYRSNRPTPASFVSHRSSHKFSKVRLDSSFLTFTITQFFQVEEFASS
jgi:hypothetical protein